MRRPDFLPPMCSTTVALSEAIRMSGGTRTSCHRRSPSGFSWARGCTSIDIARSSPPSAFLEHLRAERLDAVVCGRRQLLLQARGLVLEQLVLCGCRLRRHVRNTCAEPVGDELGMLGVDQADLDAVDHLVVAPARRVVDPAPVDG